MSAVTETLNATVQPYLYFDGRCEEALEFYRDHLGAKIEFLMRFKEAPQTGDGCTPPPGFDPSRVADKVMHCSFRIGNTALMASDGMSLGKASFQGISLTINAADEAEADRLFAALADGGQVQMPLTKTFYSPRFGMVADRFGVSWMVIVPGPTS